MASNFGVVRLRPVWGAALAAGLLAACSSVPAPTSGLGERLVAVTQQHELIAFHAGAPQNLLERRPLTGLAPGERLVGIDYRVARGVLYALAQTGRLYTLDVPSGALRPVGEVPPPLALRGAAFGFDFNPAADRIRVVSSSGQNLRLHPDTGALVDGDAAAGGVQPDPALRYAWSDRHAGRSPDIVAAAYTYHPKDDKLTTNYAIDRALGMLVMQGSREGTTPVVSPNTGQLRAVGPLGLGPLADAAFDIADVGSAALLAARAAADAPTRLYSLDLETGRATLLGVVGDGSPLRGMAIAP
jgi:hypothetical protein